MSAVYVPHPEVGFLHAGVDDLVRKLQYGDGIHFSGDPRLYLTIGVITKHRKVVARRYEVWRHCEDGQDRMIGHWRLEEFDQILPDIARMRAAAETRTSIEDAIARIDRINAAKEKEQQDLFVDRMGEVLDHALRLEHDTTEGRNTFRGIPGLRDKRLKNEQPTEHSNAVD